MIEKLTKKKGELNTLPNFYKHFIKCCVAILPEKEGTNATE